MSNTIKLHRVLKAKPAKVYKAFITPDALVKWVCPYGFTANMGAMELAVGGGYQMSFTNFTTDHSHSFQVKFVEIVPNERLVYTDKFDDPNLPGEMKVTVSFKEVLCGTELNITQEGIPAMIPVELCYLGWQESLAQLANLVEPVIDC